VSGIELPPGALTPGGQPAEEDPPKPKLPICPFISQVVNDLCPPKFAGAPPTMVRSIAFAECEQEKCGVWNKEKQRCGAIS
jgi:hypothetical protein